MGYSW